MEEATLSFKARAERALADPTLKIAIDRTTGTAEAKRAVLKRYRAAGATRQTRATPA